MRDKKRVWEIFSFYDRSGLERRLARMAEKGWLLEKIGTSLWTYRRIPPRKLTFCVYWFPTASAFDPEPSEEQRTFYDFCQHTGWVLAASYGQMQVFYNEAEDPTPIETDPMTAVDAIHRAVKRTTLPIQLVLLVMALVNGALFISRLLNDPVGILASAGNLFTGLCWVDVILMAAVECGSYFLWRRRAVRAAEQGEFWEAKGPTKFQLGSLTVMGVGLVYYLISILISGRRMMYAITLLMFGVYLPCVYGLVGGVRALLKRLRVSTAVNRAVTIVSAFAVSFGLIGAITMGTLFASSHGWFAGRDEETYTYHGTTFTARRDTLPLTVEDLLGVDYDGYSREQRVEQSLLLAQYEMTQRARFDAADYKEMPRLEYTVTLVRVPALYDLCKNAVLADWEDDWLPEGMRDYALSVDSAPWGAKEAYRLTSQEYGPRNRFLLCYEDRLVEIRFGDWTPTPEQMALTGETLGA